MSVIYVMRREAVTRLVMHDLALPLTESVLLPRCGRIALNLTRAIEIHPGALAQRRKTRTPAA